LMMTFLSSVFASKIFLNIFYYFLDSGSGN
jgi:hypothetical protein